MKLLLLLLGCFTMVSGAVVASEMQPEAVPGEYLVKLKKQKPNGGLSTMSIINSLGGSVVSDFKGDANLKLVKMAGPIKDRETTLKALSSNQYVEYAEPNYILRIDSTPNDPGFEKTWGLKNTGSPDPSGESVAGIDIDAVRAWDISTGSRDVVVGVIDTGVDYKHPDLMDNLWVNEAEKNGKPGVDDDGNGFVDDIYGYNFATNTGDPLDGHGHGTHCSGTIGGSGNNGLGVAGVNWQVKIMAIKFLTDQGSGSLANAVKAIDYATQMGARLTSNSWGGGGASQAMQDAIQRAADKGVLFVAAAGNSSTNNDVNPHYPSTYPVENVLAVAAIDSSGKLASFSSYGAKTVHVGAPGVNVYSTVKGGKYAVYSGTSMATPHVSGIAALILSKEKNLNAVQLKERIMNTTSNLLSLQGKTVTGGLVNAYKALTTK